MSLEDGAGVSSGSDTDLIFRAQSGDIYALEEIIGKYKNIVRQKARKYFIIGADKEDVIQEGTIGLFKAVRDYDSSKSPVFSQFASVCITRQIITGIKSASRQKHELLNKSVSLNSEVYEDESELIDKIENIYAKDPQDIVIGQESFMILNDKIDKTLSVFEKKVLYEYLAGKSYSEISLSLKKPQKSIDNALQRIKKKISKSIIT